MTATALVFYGAALIVFCLCGAISEKYLFPNDKPNDVEKEKL